MSFDVLYNNSSVTTIQIYTSYFHIYKYGGKLLDGKGGGMLLNSFLRFYQLEPKFSYL